LYKKERERQGYRDYVQMEINRGVGSGLAEKQNRSIISRISGTIKNWLIINSA